MTDGSRDFDFLIGRWTVQNRRLLNPLSGSTQHIQFSGKSVCRPLWDGAGNYEKWEADTPDGLVRAISVHLYDPRARQWSLHWATKSTGRFGVPTVGDFESGKGVFVNQEDFKGRTILLRLIWEPRGDDRARFEQAFSDDQGRSWETNWTMDFTRQRQ